MRKAVYHLLTTDAPLVALLPADKWLERGAVKDSQRSPFAVLAWQGEVARGKGLLGVPRLTIWVYQHRGSYDMIDAVLKRCRVVLEGVAQYTFEDQRIAQADFEGSSVDLYDELYQANARSAGYRVIGSGL